MKTLMTTTALVALLSVPVFAQGDTDQMTIEQPAATEIAPAAPAEAPAMVEEDPGLMDGETLPEAVAPDQAAETPVEAGEATEAAEAPADAKVPAIAANQQFLERQNPNEDLASNWIGKSIYNANDENLGDVNDILFAEDGTASAVIVGVGGFLGIGEKDVAVSFDAIEPRTDEDGYVTLYIQATAEQLEAAPEFLTLAEIKAEERARAAAETPPAGPGPAM